jgi:hypothetical protein
LREARGVRDLRAMSGAEVSLEAGAVRLGGCVVFSRWFGVEAVLSSVWR